MLEIAVPEPAQGRWVMPFRPEVQPWAIASTVEAVMMRVKMVLGEHAVMSHDSRLQQPGQVRALARIHGFPLDVLVVAAVLCVAAGMTVVEITPGQHLSNPHSGEGWLVSSPARLVRRCLKSC
jgi:hypothetical protein